jgi:hypothetical protein
LPEKKNPTAQQEPHGGAGTEKRPNLAASYPGPAENAIKKRQNLG